MLLRCSGTHRYKWIQNRAKERVHASQVFPAACRILIATFKAHLVCRLTKSLSTLCFCSFFPDVQGCTTWKIQSVSSIKYSFELITLCQIAACKKHAASVCQIYRIYLVGC